MSTPGPTQALYDAAHRAANDATVLVALAEFTEADPARLPELLREIRARCPALAKMLREAAAEARKSAAGPPDPPASPAA